MSILQLLPWALAFLWPVRGVVELPSEMKAPCWLADAVALWRCGSWAHRHQTSLWRDMRRAWIALITTVVVTSHTSSQEQMTVLWKYGTIRYSFYIAYLLMLNILLTVSYRTVQTWVVELCFEHNNKLRHQELHLNCGLRIPHENNNKCLLRF